MTADVSTVDTLKNIGVHSKLIPKCVLTDAHIQHTTRYDIAFCSRADKLMKSRRVLEMDKIGKGLGLTPHRLLSEVTPH